MTSDERPRDLSPRARALLGAYRQEDQLPVWVEERVRRKLLARPSRPSKLGLFALATMATAAAVLWISHTRRPARQESSSELNAASLQQEQGDTRQDARLRSAEKPRRDRDAVPSDEPSSVGASGEQPQGPAALAPHTGARGTRARAASSGRPRAVDPGDTKTPDPGAGQLAREQAALDQVRQALATRRFERAQVELEHFRTTFPQGQLDDEAIALETMLVCQRDPARSAELLREFLRQNSGSLFSHQVRSACASR